MGALDISIVYLQVDQPQPKNIRQFDAIFINHHCLPGQKDGSKFSGEVCDEVPCLFPSLDGNHFFLVHVHDVFDGSLHETLEPVFEYRFQIAVQYVAVLQKGKLPKIPKIPGALHAFSDGQPGELHALCVFKPMVVQVFI